MRTGLLAKKLGMTRVFDEQRKHNSVTVLEMPFNTVVAQKKIEKDGYNALVIGFDKVKPASLNKPSKVFFEKNKILALKRLKEFKISDDNFVEVGKSINVSHFTVGQYVDVKAYSIGKGFAGAMKRHNFAGLRASHGVSVSHRSHGSTGNSQDPGRVWKGKKMAGQLGNKMVTIQSLEVVSIDAERGLILVKGGVPGSIGSWVSITDAKKKSLPAATPYPAAIDVNSNSENLIPKKGTGTEENREEKEKTNNNEEKKVGKTISENKKVDN